MMAKIDILDAGQHEIQPGTATRSSKEDN
jgi:hypothetical protein